MGKVRLVTAIGRGGGVGGGGIGKGRGHGYLSIAIYLAMHTNQFLACHIIHEYSNNTLRFYQDDTLTSYVIRQLGNFLKCCMNVYII